VSPDTFAFFDLHPDLALRSLRIARLANLVWPLLGTVMVYWLAFRCFGRRASYVATLLWAFFPLVIGHGVLLPPDLAAAVMVMAVAMMGAMIEPPFFVWRAAGVGLVLGLAILTKATLVVLFPLLIFWIFFQWRKVIGPWHWREPIREVIVMSIFSWFAINLGYGWEGCGTRLGDFQFVSSRLDGVAPAVIQPGNIFRETLLAHVPIFLPANFVLEIDTQYKGFEINFFYPYLLGRWHRGGFLTFYLWYFLLKLPVGVLALVGIGMIGTSFRLVDIKHSSLLFLVTAIGVVLLWFLSWRTDLNYCRRYRIVCLPSLCLLAAGGSTMFRGPIANKVLWMLVLTTVGAGIGYSPHALSYYNGLVGGPEGGRFSLHGNATDWGQDAIRIGNWCQEHPDRRPLSVGTVGYLSSLKAYGVEADAVRFEVDSRASWDDSVRGQKISAAGWHIVSFVHLLDPRSPYHAFLYQAPTESIGWTHLVFYIGAQKAASLSGRSEIVLPGESL